MDKIFLEKIVFSLEWKIECVMDDDSWDDEGDEGEKDWLRQGWRHTHDNKMSQTMSFKQSVNVNNKHIQWKIDYLYLYKTRIMKLS